MFLQVASHEDYHWKKASENWLTSADHSTAAMLNQREGKCRKTTLMIKNKQLKYGVWRITLNLLSGSSESSASSSLLRLSSIVNSITNDEKVNLSGDVSEN